MKKGIIRQILVIITVALVITINALAESLPFNNVSTKVISDSFKVYFVPAAYVFSIWGLIYLGLIAFAIFQALPSQRENPRMQKVAGFFMISSAANCLWLVKWHYQEFLSSLVLMLVLLVSLIAVYIHLGTGTQQKVSKAEVWMARLPFSIYLGWITVATIANVADVLFYYNWSGWGIDPQLWSAIMLGVAVIVAALMAFTKRDTAYLVVLLWAFAGIAVKFQDVELVFGAAVIAAVTAALLAGYTLLPKKRA